MKEGEERRLEAHSVKRSYRSAARNKKRKKRKNIDRLEPPCRSFKLESSTFKLSDAAGMNVKHCAGGGFKVQRESTAVCLPNGSNVDVTRWCNRLEITSNLPRFSRLYCLEREAGR